MQIQEYRMLLEKSTHTTANTAFDRLVDLCFESDFPESFYFRFGDFGIWIFCPYSIRVFQGDGYKGNDDEINEYDFETLDRLIDGFVVETGKTMFEMMTEIHSDVVECIPFSNPIKHRPLWFRKIKKELDRKR